MNKELLEQYRQIKSSGKVICHVYLEVHRNEKGELYACKNESYVIGLVNADESLLDEFLEAYLDMVECFGITDTGDYEFECVLDDVGEQRSFEASVQPDFPRYYELGYYERA